MYAYTLQIVFVMFSAQCKSICLYFLSEITDHYTVDDKKHFDIEK